MEWCLALLYENTLQGLQVVGSLVNVFLGGRQLPGRRVVVPNHICIHILQQQITHTAT